MSFVLCQFNYVLILWSSYTFWCSTT